MDAYCFPNGVIKYGRKTPEGAITIGSGKPKALRKAIDVVARWSYPSKPGAGDEVPLVPGIPEADNQNEGVDALIRFRRQVEKRLVNQNKS